MTWQPFTIGRWDSLAKARQFMRDKAIRHLPVLDAGRLVGIVRSGDLRLLETIAGFPLDAVDVDEAMIARPYTVARDMPIDEVVEMMTKHDYGCAIVIGPNDAVEGIFTTADAMRMLVELLRPAA
jgi:acetoin utilization protein AcuB